ncbi:hypothetical protein OE699_15355 [Sedimentimonas flavescens]|uniref:Uncharacterized protein n=1 Tax=Sedimentimonas flavescens TaxID=2851012 RepID=A0ABT3A2J9_9RHOB|nr:hypothetical protein [Sedimentimonas flavescens]MCV2880220.1 hypothetical protein [Sedimentimonas flavescens]
MTEKKYNLSLWIWVALFSVYIAVYAYRHPSYNWDMIGYVGSVEKLSGTQKDSLRVRTYEDVKSSVSAEKYFELTDVKDEYRYGVSQLDAAFLQQLPFYEIRIAYLVLVKFVSNLTNTISLATVVVSAISGALIVWVAAWIISDLDKDILLFLPFFLSGCGLMELATVSTPDALANLCALFLLGLSIRRPVATSWLAPALVLVRTDYIILAILMVLEASMRKKLRITLLSIPIATVLVFMINGHFGNYGYLAILNLTLISGPVLFPENISISGNIADYIAPYHRGLERLLGGMGLGLVFLAIRLFHRRGKILFRDRYVRLAVVSIAFVLVHFLLFPAGFLRFYMFALIFVSLVVIRRLFSGQPHSTEVS